MQQYNQPKDIFHGINTANLNLVQQVLAEDPEALNRQFNNNGMTPLIRACVNGAVDIAKYLIEVGADLNARSGYGETAVLCSARRGQMELIERLVQQGADPSTSDSKGQGAQHYVAMGGNIQTAHYLQEVLHLSMGERDASGKTALHHAVSHGHLDMVAYLLRRERCDPDTADNEGMTALHVACQHNSPMHVWKLLGAVKLRALHVVDAKGRKPYDIAIANKRQKNKALLNVLQKLMSTRQHDQKPPPPLLYYYWLAAMPFVLYWTSLLAALVISGVTGWSQGWCFLPFALLYARVLTNQGHRINHPSHNWPNPMFAGFLYGHIVNSIIIFYFHNAPAVGYPPVLIFFLILMNGVMEYLHISLFFIDPGVHKKPDLHATTGQPVTVRDLCYPPYSVTADMSFKTKAKLQDRFCGFCEFIPPVPHKHCKLCEVCIDTLDHHCLFILRCVAWGNVRRFTWFIILVFLANITVIVSSFNFVNAVYPGKSMSQGFMVLFHDDGWVSSMLCLNLGCVFWTVGLLRNILGNLAHGRTGWIQPPGPLQDLLSLTINQRLNNLSYILFNKGNFTWDPAIQNPQAVWDKHQVSLGRALTSSHSHADSQSVVPVPGQHIPVPGQRLPGQGSAPHSSLTMAPGVRAGWT